MQKTITSPQNPFAKHLVLLRQNKKYRYEKKSVLVPGNKLTKVCLKEKKIKTLITTNKEFLSLYKNSILVTKKIMQKITNLPSPEPLAAEVLLPSNKIIKKDYILILDNIQDPGNLGTIIRTAYSFNWDGIIILENSVDPFNEKAIRAAKGASFFMPMEYEKKENLKPILKKRNAYLADIEGNSIEKLNVKPPIVLILSNEANGIDKSLIPLTKKVTIPMNKSQNSLNVAISAGILLYLMRKQ